MKKIRESPWLKYLSGLDLGLVCLCFWLRGARWRERAILLLITEKDLVILPSIDGFDESAVGDGGSAPIPREDITLCINSASPMPMLMRHFGEMALCIVPSAGCDAAVWPPPPY